MPNTDISEYLNAIESAESGEVVRDAVHDAINRLATNGVSNAQTLDGHPASDFALKSDVGSLNNLDQIPTQGHYTVGVTSGGVWDAIHDSTEVLATMTMTPAEDMNLYQAVTAVKTAAGNISNALNRKTAEINHELDLSGTVFTRWEEAINNWDITTIKEIDLSDKEFTENTTDLPGGWADAGEGKAWKRVKVEVSPKLTSASIDELDEHYSGKVDISDEEYKDYDGFDEVSVNIADGFMDLDLGNGFLLDNGWRYIADGTGHDHPPEDRVKYFGTKENPVYGFRQVNIVIDQNSKFTVTFWNEAGDAVLAMVENVPYGGYATFPSDITIPPKTGYTFDKWNPNPVNVMSNMNVYASYIKNSEKQSTVTSTWGELTENGSGKLLRGVTKSLFVGDIEGFDPKHHITATLINPQKNIWCATITPFPMFDESVDTEIEGAWYKENSVWKQTTIKLGIDNTVTPAGRIYYKESFDNTSSDYYEKRYRYIGYDWYGLQWEVYWKHFVNGSYVKDDDRHEPIVYPDYVAGKKYLDAMATAILNNEMNRNISLVSRLETNSVAIDENKPYSELSKYRDFGGFLIPLGVWDYVDPTATSVLEPFPPDPTSYLNRSDFIATGGPDEVPGWGGAAGITTHNISIQTWSRSAQWDAASGHEWWTIAGSLGGSGSNSIHVTFTLG